MWGVRATEAHRNPGDSALKTWLFHTLLGLSSKFLPKKIITNSTMAIGVHERMGYPTSKFVWIPNGVNSERFAPRPDVARATREDLGVPQDAPVIGFVGRFHPVKDIALLFRAAAILQAQRPEVYFVLAGGLPENLYPAAREAYDRLPLPQQVRFVPFGPRTDRLYPAFTLFTLTSESEAFPNVVLEAMATGLPCAATEAGDCAVMLKDLGEVVPLHDHDALAAAWLKLLSLSPEDRQALAVKSRTRAVEDYSTTTESRRLTIATGLASGGELFERITQAGHYSEREAATFVAMGASTVQRIASRETEQRALRVGVARNAVRCKRAARHPRLLGNSG